MTEAGRTSDYTALSPMTAFFVLSAVKTSNLTFLLVNRLQTFASCRNKDVDVMSSPPVYLRKTPGRKMYSLQSSPLLFFGEI